MCAHEFTEPRSAAPRVESVLTWLGGGPWHELGERHERSTHAITGAVVALGAVLAWLVATVAVSESARLPVLAVVALTLVFGLLVGAVTRGTASGPARGWPGIAGRAAVAVALGVVVGELAALVVFSGSIEHRLDQRALRTADSAPAVAQASESLQQTRDARGALDNAVEQARDQQDKALVVARCEYNPTPACPQTRITGVPGAGPETRTANQLLGDAQHALDNALATRDRRAPELDAKISAEQRSLTQARQSVIAEADRGLGARWVAMNDLTLAIGAQVLRLLTIAFFTLLYLLPLILLRWRGETTHDRHSAARADHERAELEADTAIAIKRAEVRREAEIMWAEHQLTQARLTIEAQAEIDREQQRRRVIEALDGPIATSSQRTFEPVAPDMYPPIAAEAAAAGRAVAQLPAGAQDARAETAENLPAQIQPNDVTEPHHEHATPLIPRWIRPLVPPFVARVIDNTTQPLRTARHVFGEVFEEVFEEVEEITFALKRTRRVTVSSGSSDTSDQPPPASGDAEIPESPSPADRAESSRSQASAYEEYSSLGRAPTKDVGGLSLGSAERDSLLELMEREGTRELRSPEGPRQLPPAE